MKKGVETMLDEMWNKDVETMTKEEKEQHIKDILLTVAKQNNELIVNGDEILKHNFFNLDATSEDLRYFFSSEFSKKYTGRLKLTILLNNPLTKLYYTIDCSRKHPILRSDGIYLFSLEEFVDIYKNSPKKVVKNSKTDDVVEPVIVEQLDKIIDFMDYYISLKRVLRSNATDAIKMSTMKSLFCISGTKRTDVNDEVIDPSDKALYHLSSNISTTSDLKMDDIKHLETTYTKSWKGEWASSHIMWSPHFDVLRIKKLTSVITYDLLEKAVMIQVLIPLSSYYDTAENSQIVSVKIHGNMELFNQYWGKVKERGIRCFSDGVLGEHKKSIMDMFSTIKASKDVQKAIF